MPDDLLSNPLYRAAQAYALRLRWPVFPCRARAKEPLTEHGYLDASLDPKAIRDWWTEWPEANIGVPTGVAFFVLDKDPRNGGDQSMMELVARHGPLADTLQQATGGGGQHRLYLPPDKYKVRSISGLWPGIDIKGQGGYIIVAPSIHPSGNPYFWDTVTSIFDDPPRRADTWLILAIIQAAKNPNGAPLSVIPPKIPEGERNNWLWQAATSMRRKGFNSRPIFAALMAMKDDLEKPIEGYQKHVSDMTERVCRYPAGHRFTAADRNGREAEKPAFALPVPMTLDELLDADLPAPEPLIENLLPRRGVATMTGAQRTGKTIFAAQTALALASNRPLLDYYRLSAHGPVIIVEKDDPGANAGFKAMFERAGRPRGLAIDFYDRKSIPEEFTLGPAINDWLRKIVPARGAVMVVLDSLTALRAHRRPGADLTKEEYDLVSGMDALAKELGFCILLLHHESITTRANSSLDWDARGAGSFGIGAATEGAIRIARYHELGIDAPERHLIFRGSRQMREHEATFAYNPQTGLFEHIVNGPAAHYYESIRDIRRHIETAEFTAKDLEEPLGVSRATAFRMIGRLRACGVVWRAHAGAYRLAPEYEKLRLPETGEILRH